MVETEEFGNMLFLDGMVMTSEKDEFVYHEMVAHVPLFTHPNPEHVLVVGGGDGGVIREILKHPSVKKATLVDIDGKVIEYSKKFLPSIAGKLDDPRVDVQVDDVIYLHVNARIIQFACDRRKELFRVFDNLAVNIYKCRFFHAWVLQDFSDNAAVTAADYENVLRIWVRK